MSTTITVTSAAELNQALSQATGGETILLAAGDYGGLNLHYTNFASNVTIKSADPNAMASFSAVHIKQSSNITFDNIKFDYTYSSGDYHFQTNFGVYDSQNIAFNNSIFEGDLASDGTGHGTALTISGSANVDITNTEFTKWWKAVIAVNSDGIDVIGNDIHTIRSDGLVFDNVDNILVEDNHLHDFGGVAGSQDHRDMIQIQRANGSGSDNIIIRNNVFDMGAGDFTQTIWAGGDGKDTSDPNVIHHNVLIEGNTIYNGHFHGISLDGVDGLTIIQNSVLHVDDRTLSGGIEIPVINVTPGSTNVTIEQNIASQIIGYNGQTDWNVSNNALIQPGEYDQNFTYQATAQADGYNHYVTIPGSLADAVNAGSSLTGNTSGTGTTQPSTGTTQPSTGTTQPDPDSTPTDGDSAPTDGASTPTDGDSAPTDGDSAPTDGDSVPTDGDSVPTDGDSAPTDGDSTPTDGDSTPTDGDSTPTDGDSAPTDGEPDQSDTGSGGFFQSFFRRWDSSNDTDPVSADTGSEQPATEPEQTGTTSQNAMVVDITDQDSRGNIGTLNGFSDSPQISLSVDVTQDEDAGAERLVWNQSNFGLKLNKKGHLVVNVDNNDGGFRDSFKIKNLDLNDGDTHQVTLMADQDTDQLQVLVDGVVVLNETETDLDFAGGRERDWYVGDSVDTFAIDDEAPFVEQYFDLSA